MNINFTGIKNPGYYAINMYPARTYDDTRVQYSEDKYIAAKYLTMELTDDFNGKDLSEYKTKLKQSNLGNLINSINPNFLNFGILKGELPADKGTYFVINGTAIELEDEHLPIISFIAQKLGQLKNDTNSVIVDKDYYKSDIAANSLMLGRDIRDDYNYYENPLEDLKRYHNLDIISDGAEKMLQLLDNKMMEYLDIPPEKRK